MKHAQANTVTEYVSNVKLNVSPQEKKKKIIQVLLEIRVNHSSL